MNLSIKLNNLKVASSYDYAPLKVNAQVVSSNFCFEIYSILTTS